jgi:hypothetical protein
MFVLRGLSAASVAIYRSMGFVLVAAWPRYRCCKSTVGETTFSVHATDAIATAPPVVVSFECRDWRKQLQSFGLRVYIARNGRRIRPEFGARRALAIVGQCQMSLSGGLESTQFPRVRRCPNRCSTGKARVQAAPGSGPPVDAFR